MDAGNLAYNITRSGRPGRNNGCFSKIPLNPWSTPFTPRYDVVTARKSMRKSASPRALLAFHHGVRMAGSSGGRTVLVAVRIPLFFAQLLQVASSSFVLLSPPLLSLTVKKNARKIMHKKANFFGFEVLVKNNNVTAFPPPLVPPVPHLRKVCTPSSWLLSWWLFARPRARSVHPSRRRRRGLRRLLPAGC